ncbi:hypothetical protein IFM89_031412 [Coptis chinensis]|uniref:Protein BIC1 n=1 Tax=Coptis chinensis TaxID=261450 RepID=A0A835HI41_9MAGN|nr:hypothetical protein IFM89_031412 [Coptis chinensis]
MGLMLQYNRQVSHSKCFAKAEKAKKQQFQDDQVAFKGVYDAVESKRESFDTLLLPVKIHQTNIDRVSMHRPCPTSTDKAKESVDKSLPEVSGREKLKRHRVEVAGQVWIPDIWGQEELLKDWIDCSAFDASLIPTGIMSARAALIQESVRRNSGGCVKS